MLLLADGLDDLYNRVRLVSTLADQDQRLVADLKDSASRLDLLLKAVDDQKRESSDSEERTGHQAEEIQDKIAPARADARGGGPAGEGRHRAGEARQKAEQERLQAELEAQAQAALLAAQAHILNGGQIYRAPARPTTPSPTS